MERSSNTDIEIEISLCEYLDLWLIGKEADLKTSTFEGYAYRVEKIKEYFSDKKLKLVDITAKDWDDFYRYCLKYGKINQKTHEREPLAVRSVRSYKSILYAAFTQAAIDGLIKYNPAIGVKVHGKKNKNY